MTNDEKILQLLSEMNVRLTDIDGRLTNIEQEAVIANERLTHVEQEAVIANERLTHVEQEAIIANERLAHVEQEVVKTNLTIENDITRRLNALTDGYCLTHEKQYELERKFERKIEALEKRIEQLEIKAS